MLQAPGNSIFVWSNGQLTHPLSPRLHNMCWHTVWPAASQGLVIWASPGIMASRKGASEQFRAQLYGPRWTSLLRGTEPLGEGNHWFGSLCVSDCRWEVRKGPVMVVWNPNLDSVMKSVILTALQAALLRTPDSIWYSEVNVLCWAWK